MISSFRDENAFLSNMFVCTISYQGRMYPSVENAYQAMKCINEADKDAFMSCSPSEAKKMGRQVKMRPDFEQNKYKLMRALLDIKFDTNKDLMKKLLDTQPESLVEGNWWHDNYWGICQCDKCKGKIHENKLGELLQRKRNLSGEHSDMFTVYCGSIYRRSDQVIINRPAALIDPDDDRYTVLKVCDYDTCLYYHNQMTQQNTELFQHLMLYEFDTASPDNPMATHIACEKMNMLLQFTGAAKRILELP